jgi:hypothetical protein
LLAPDHDASTTNVICSEPKREFIRDADGRCDFESGAARRLVANDTVYCGAAERYRSSFRDAVSLRTINDH